MSEKLGPSSAPSEGFEGPGSRPPSSDRREYRAPVLTPVLHHTDTQFNMGKEFDSIREDIGAMGGKAS